MRIFKNTDRTLTLWQNNWRSIWIPTLVFGGVLISLIFYGNEVKLACYRSTPLSGQCQIEENSFFDNKNQSISFENIQKMDLEADSGEEEPQTRVLLISKDGQMIPVTLRGNAEERDLIANQLATFLGTPTASVFKITDGNLTFGYLIIGAAGLTCLAWLLAGGWTIVKFDKDKNECTVSNWTIQGKKIDRYVLNHIDGVDVEIKNTWGSIGNRLVLFTEQGHQQALSKRYLSSNSYEREKKVARKVAEFLDINYYITDQDS